MEKLKAVKERLMHCIESQVYGDLKVVDSKELGEAIDMIADLEEAIYYCTITKAMEKSEKEKEKNSHQESSQHYYPYYYRDLDRDSGKLYYPYSNMNNRGYSEYNQMYYGGGNSSNGSSSSMGYRDGNAQSIGESRNYPMDMRDIREGRSPMSRKTYMESKEMHKDTKAKMQDLEHYMQELSHDMVEMIEGATPEEKQLLQQKLTLLASKVK